MPAKHSGRASYCCLSVCLLFVCVRERCAYAAAGVAAGCRCRLSTMSARAQRPPRQRPGAASSHAQPTQRACQRRQLFRVDEREGVREVHEVLEAGVQVRLGAQRDHHVPVRVIHVRVHAEQALEDRAHRVQEAVRERLVWALREDLQRRARERPRWPHSAGPNAPFRRPAGSPPTSSGTARTPAPCTRWASSPARASLTARARAAPQRLARAPHAPSRRPPTGTRTSGPRTSSGSSPRCSTPSACRTARRLRCKSQPCSPRACEGDSQRAPLSAPPGRRHAAPRSVPLVQVLAGRQLHLREQRRAQSTRSPSLAGRASSAHRVAQVAAADGGIDVLLQLRVQLRGRRLARPKRPAAEWQRRSAVFGTRRASCAACAARLPRLSSAAIQRRWPATASPAPRACDRGPRGSNKVAFTKRTARVTWAPEKRTTRRDATRRASAQCVVTRAACTARPRAGGWRTLRKAATTELHRPPEEAKATAASGGANAACLAVPRHDGACARWSCATTRAFARRGVASSSVVTKIAA